MQGARAIKTKSQLATKVVSRKPPRVSNVTLDAKHPIPLESGKAFLFVNNVSYLPFFSPKDRFAKDLLEARLLSTTHNACIVTKKDYCAGQGFRDNDGKEFTPEIIAWFNSMNLKNQSVIKVNRKLFEDYFTLGNVPLEIHRFTSGGVRKLFIYPQNMLEWRLAKPDPDDDIVKQAIQSKLFLRERNNFITAEELNKSARILPLYNPLANDEDNWEVDSKGVERTLIWYKNEVSGIPYYGMPGAIASIIYQILEYKGARYNLDLFDNEMIAASVLAIKGSLSQSEADRIAKKIINTYTGDGRRGRTIVVASEEGIEGSDLHKMDTEKEGSFNDADDKWTQKIILANQWDAILAGIVSPSTFGKGAGFITKIAEEKLNKVIRPAQDDLMDEVWISIFKIAEEWLKLPFSNYDIKFKNIIDISGLTDVDITAAVQVNEVRKAKGLAEDPKMDGVYLKQSAPAAAPPPEDDPNDPKSKEKGNGGPPKKDV